MRKILDAGIFKRDLSFPIHFEGQIITASPGDTLASAILANNREHTINSSVYNCSDSLISTCASSGHFLNLGESKLAYLDCWLGQEVYPGFTFNNQKNWHDNEDCHPSAGQPNANLFHKRLKGATKFSKDQLFKLTPWLVMNELVDPDIKEKEEAMTFVDVEHVSVELLVIGSGVAGLVASLVSSKAGIRLMLLESDFILGGRLNSEGQSNNTWLRNTILDLENHEHVRICNRTQFLKRDSDGTFLAIEKCFKLDSTNSAHPIYKLLRIKAEHAFIACGATERIPIPLDKTIPGIMSAGFFNTCLNRFGLGPNEGVSIYTNNDAAWNTVKYLMSLGLKIDAVIDTRLNSTMVADYPVFRGARIIKVLGKSHLRGIIIRDSQGRRTKIKTSLLAVSGGYNTDFGIVNDSIQKLEWCPGLSSFKAQLNSPDLTLLGGANAVFCPNHSIETSYQSACQLIKSKGLKVMECDLPHLDKENYECQIVERDEGRFRQNWFRKSLEKSVTYFVESYNEKNIHHKKNTNKLEEMKSKALSIFSNDDEVTNIIKSQTGGADIAKRAAKTTFDITNSLFSICNEGKKTLQPFRALPGHFEYEKQGAYLQRDGDWLIPRYFLRENSIHKETDPINLEIEATCKNVGISDMSDLMKIEITGKNATNFIQKSLGLKKVGIRVNECQEGFLIDRDGTILDQMVILRMGDNNYILTASNCNETVLYNYLIDVLFSRCADPGVNVNLITEFHQAYSVWGPRAGELLEGIFGLESSVLDLLPMKPKTINFQNCKCVIYRSEERSIPSFRVLISPGDSLQFLMHIKKNLSSCNGLLIGRFAAEIIELENWCISSKKLREFYKTGKRKESLETPIVGKDKKIFDQLLRFESLKEKKSYYRMAILHSIGPTKNIVEGSEVHSIDRDGKNLLLGQVLASYFSRVKGTFVGYVYLEQAEKVLKKPVVVLNLGKEYQTECELSSFDMISGSS